MGTQSLRRTRVLSAHARWVLAGAVAIGVVLLALSAFAPGARAEVGNPKQRFIDQMAADEAHARSLAGKPAPMTAGKPVVSIDVSQYREGFFETPNYPCPSSLCLIRNEYQTVRNGRVIQVYAGSERPDTTQGFLYIKIVDPNGVGGLGEGTFRTPIKAGPLHLESVTGDVLSFTTGNGTHGTFNFATRQFGP